jgi:hypothetical protein
MQAASRGSLGCLERLYSVPAPHAAEGGGLCTSSRSRRAGPPGGAAPLRVAGCVTKLSRQCMDACAGCADVPHPASANGGEWSEAEKCTYWRTAHLLKGCSAEFLTTCHALSLSQFLEHRNPSLTSWLHHTAGGLAISRT